eukprot:747660-Pleurochrysis_carterae.AAC.1
MAHTCPMRVWQDLHTSEFTMCARVRVGTPLRPYTRQSIPRRGLTQTIFGGRRQSARRSSPR